MSKERFHQRFSTLSYLSGFQEAKELAPEKLLKNLQEATDKTVFLTDGSTSVANFRAIEGIVTLLAAHRLRGIARKIYTFVVGGGRADWAASDLNLELAQLELRNEVLSQLKDLFPEVPLDERNYLYFPPEAFKGFAGSSLREALVTQRKALIRQSAESIGLDISLVDILSFEDLPPILPVTLSDVLIAETDGSKTVVKFICLDCSRQQKKPVEHGILPSGITIRTDGGRKIKCKPAVSIFKGLNQGELGKRSIADLIKLGFYPSGRSLYRLNARLASSEDILLVRNYSSARHIMDIITGSWPGKIGISRRYYFSDRVEIPGFKLPAILDQNPSLCQAIIQDPLLVVIPEEEVILPCENH